MSTPTLIIAATLTLEVLTLLVLTVQTLTIRRINHLVTELHTGLARRPNGGPPSRRPVPHLLPTFDPTTPWDDHPHQVDDPDELLDYPLGTP